MCHIHDTRRSLRRSLTVLIPFVSFNNLEITPIFFKDHLGNWLHRLSRCLVACHCYYSVLVISVLESKDRMAQKSDLSVNIVTEQCCWQNLWLWGPQCRSQVVETSLMMVMISSDLRKADLSRWTVCLHALSLVCISLVWMCWGWEWL